MIGKEEEDYFLSNLDSINQRISTSTDRENNHKVYDFETDEEKKKKSTERCNLVKNIDHVNTKNPLTLMKPLKNKVKP